MPGKTPMWGNPTRERERERERDLLFSFRKVHISSKTTFPAKENTSQHQICPKEICLIFRAKIVPLSCLFRTSFFVPTVHCMDCSYSPKTATEKLKIASKTVPKIASFSVPNPYDSYKLYRSIQYGLPQQKKKKKKNRPKIHRKIFLGIVPIFLEKCALFATHFPLSSILRKSL
jgi:hypothetical protein